MSAPHIIIYIHNPTRLVEQRYTYYIYIKSRHTHTGKSCVETETEKKIQIGINNNKKCVGFSFLLVNNVVKKRWGAFFFY